MKKIAIPATVSATVHRHPVDKLNSTRERKMQVYPEHLRLNLRVLSGNAERWSELDIENRLDFTTEWSNQMFDLEDTARRLNLYVPDIPDELYPKSPLREAM